jgi:hypothetical protein
MSKVKSSSGPGKSARQSSDKDSKTLSKDKQVIKSLKGQLRSDTAKKRSKKALTSIPVSLFLKAINGYGLTLQDPFRFRGVKVPDYKKIKTVTCSTTDRWTITASAQGCCATSVRLGQRLQYIDNDSDLTPHGTENTPMIALSSADSAPDYLFANATFQGLQASPILVANYGLVRIVSAMLIIQYTGATLSDSGLMCTSAIDPESFANLIQSYPPGVSVKPQLNNGIFDELIDFPDATTVPINKHRTMYCRYTPMDERYVDFCTPLYDSLNQDTNGGYIVYNVADSSPGFPMPSYPASSEPPNDIEHGDQRAVFTAACTGLQPGATCYCVLTINWEAVPIIGTFVAGDASPSPSDPDMFSLGLNTSADKPITGEYLDVVPSSTGSSRIEQTTGGLYYDPTALITHVAETAGSTKAVTDTSPAAMDKLAATSSSGGFMDAFGSAFDFVKDKAIPFLADYGPEIVSGVGDLLALL